MQVCCRTSHSIGNLKYVWQLFNFDMNKYKTNPKVTPTTTKSAVQLKKQYTKANNPDTSWNLLLNSIPIAWKQIMCRGNQSINDNEFLAMQLPNDKLGDFYQFKDNTLTRYLLDTNTGKLTKSNEINNPDAFHYESEIFIGNSGLIFLFSNIYRPYPWNQIEI